MSTTIMNRNTIAFILLVISAIAGMAFMQLPGNWQSKYVQLNADGSLQYTPDAKGNVIPDFSAVGYFHGDKTIPAVKVVKTIHAVNGSSQQVIQDALDEIAKMQPDSNGIRGALLLKRGVYNISGTIYISTGGIVIRGEGDDEKGTRLIAAGKIQRDLLQISGTGYLNTISSSKTNITDAYVPVGTKIFTVDNARKFKVGDHIVINQTFNDQWISDLKMDKIEERPGTKQWRASEYNLNFERTVTAINGNRLSVDNPVVMPIDQQYGGATVSKSTYIGRISQVGVEHLYFESSFVSDTDEAHGWTAVKIDKAENCWVKNVTSRYFGFGCVSLESNSKNITVNQSRCLDAKSIITGDRRYSFNNDGQQNLFINCATTNGRHDYVTGARTCGPNVFYNCTAQTTFADIGPHHRWSSGTLYDRISTTGEIAMQDRGNYGSGHGWAGVTQVLWNCTAKETVVQSPWVSGLNYCIGLIGKKTTGRFKDRNDGEWEGNNQTGLNPVSLYQAQLKNRQKR